MQTHGLNLAFAETTRLACFNPSLFLQTLSRSLPLQAITLAWNNIHSKSAVAILEALRRNGTLVEVICARHRTTLHCTLMQRAEFVSPLCHGCMQVDLSWNHFGGHKKGVTASSLSPASKVTPNTALRIIVGKDSCVMSKDVESAWMSE